MEVIMDRVERLLVLILLELMNKAKAPQAKKIYQLNLAGLSNIEIANLLETTSQVVSQRLHEARRTGRKKKRAKTRPKK